MNNDTPIFGAVTSTGARLVRRNELEPGAVTTIALSDELRAALGLFPGRIIWDAGTAGTPPSGWLAADGSSYSVTDYPDLFDKIGYTHGGSAGTFAVPNLVDRFPVGAGSTYAVGATGGEATHTLTTAEMPSHTHTGPSHTHPTSNGQSFATSTAGYATAAAGAAAATVANITATTGAAGTGATGSAGSGGAHNNLPPYVGLYPYIKT